MFVIPAPQKIEAFRSNGSRALVLHIYSAILGITHFGSVITNESD